MDPRTGTATPRAARLTPRQMEIASLIAEGCCDRDIADRLGVSYRTVRTHLERLYERFGIHNRTQAALLLLEESNGAALTERSTPPL